MKTITFVLFIGLVHFGCNRPASPELKESNSSDPFEISISKGGGFTGVYTGYTLYSNGMIESWSRQPGKQATVTSSYQVDPLQIEKIEQDLKASNVLNFQSDERGNFTHQLKWTFADSTRIWTWTSPEHLPVQFKEWIDSTTVYCSSLQ